MEKLSPEQIVTLVVRLFAVYLFLYLLQTSINQFGWAQVSDWEGAYFVLAVGVVILFGSALMLWLFATKIACALLKVGAADNLSHGELTENKLYDLAFIVLGFYLLYDSLGDTVYWWALVDLTNNVSELPFEFGPNQMAGVISTAVRLVLALLFIFGSRTLRKLIMWAKYAALSK